MYQNHSKGFTLIELLVVIGIIGILSAVVLASLNTARFKGNDAAIQSDLAAIQTQTEIYYGGVGGNSYGGTGNTFALGACPTTGTSMFVTDATIAKAIAGAKVANGGTDPICLSTAILYVVQSKMSADPAQNWCVDSTGTASKSGTTISGTDTKCP